MKIIGGFKATRESDMKDVTSRITKVLNTWIGL